MNKSDDKKRLEQGCGAVLQGMCGKKVCVELYGESYVLGILEGCDSNFNIKFKDVTVIRDSQNIQKPRYSVIGKDIRFVHFEHYVTPTAAIRRCINGVRADYAKKNRKLDQKQFDSGKKIIDK